MTVVGRFIIFLLSTRVLARCAFASTRLQRPCNGLVDITDKANLRGVGVSRGWITANTARLVRKTSVTASRRQHSQSFRNRYEAPPEQRFTQTFRELLEARLDPRRVFLRQLCSFPAKTFSDSRECEFFLYSFLRSTLRHKSSRIIRVCKCMRIADSASEFPRDSILG